MHRRAVIRPLSALRPTGRQQPLAAAAPVSAIATGRHARLFAAAATSPAAAAPAEPPTPGNFVKNPPPPFDFDAAKAVIGMRTKYDGIADQLAARAARVAEADRRLAAAGPQPSAEAVYAAISECVVAGNGEQAADHLERWLQAGVLAPGVELLTKIALAVVQRPGLRAERLLAPLRRFAASTRDDDRRRLADGAAPLRGIDTKERYVRLLESVGVRTDLHLLQMLVDAAAAEYNFPRARMYFEEIAYHGAKPDARAYGALIECARKARRFEDVFALETRLRESGTPLTAYPLLALMRTCGVLKPERVAALLDEVFALQPAASAADILAAHNSALASAGRQGDPQVVRRVWSAFQSRNVTPDSTTAVALFSMLRRHGNHYTVATDTLALMGISDKPGAAAPRPLTEAEIIRMSDIIQTLA